MEKAKTKKAKTKTGTHEKKASVQTEYKDALKRGEHAVYIDLDANILHLDNKEFAVERQVAELIYDMFVYNDKITENYALVAHAFGQDGSV